MSPKSPQQIEQDYATLLHTMQQLHASIIQGEVVDLAGMDAQVSQLCENILAMPKPDRTQMESKLKQMVDLMDSMASALQQQQHKQQHMKNAAAAQAAYGQAGNTNKSGH